MIDGPVDPQWPRLLSLSAHELRTPLSVIAGYTRMLLTDRAGPLTDQQRHFLTEASKASARLSDLATELSQLSDLEDGTATFNRSPADLHALLKGTVDGLPESPDRQVRVRLAVGHEPARLDADAVRLTAAFAAIILALRRETVTSSELCVREEIHRQGGASVSRILFADAERLEALAAVDPVELTAFDEWRGGCGLSLAIARRVIEAHGGHMWSAPAGPDESDILVDGGSRLRRAGVVVKLPVS